MSYYTHPKSATEEIPLLAGGLSPVNNIKQVFRDIRNFMAGNAEGITRDESIAQNLIRLILCKLYDEKYNNPPQFCLRQGESSAALSARIKQLFDRMKNTDGFSFMLGEEVRIHPEMVVFLVEKIQNYSLSDADRDAVGDAFEELIGTAFRGGMGQFFTPRNVVEMMIDIIRPKNGEKIVDPACGSGGFLSSCLRYFARRGITDSAVVGIDKDSFLAQLAGSYCKIISDNDSDIFNENSLAPPEKWNADAQNRASLGSFDIVLTNPPFGAKIPVVGRSLLSQYRLARRWQNNAGAWLETPALHDKQPPQILFIERCLQLLKKGGRMGIILPDGIFGNSSEGYVWEYITSESRVLGIVSLSQETFQPSTHTKTSVLFLEKSASKRKTSVFMSVAHAVGHDKNGKVSYKMNAGGDQLKSENGSAVIDDDLPEIVARFHGKKKSGDRFGFWIDSIANNIYIPEYYSPEIDSELLHLKKSGNFDLVSIGSLLSRQIIEIRRGNEVGSKFYGTGTVPFVRTTDIVNWEIKIDTVKKVSDKIYRLYRASQDVRVGDILLVSDGTFLIGRSAMVMEQDCKIIIQSHIKKIRVVDDAQINPYYLFYLLNTDIVRRQIEAKTFVQATISTLGKRLLEVVLPICKDKGTVNRISDDIKNIVAARTKLRKEIDEIKRVGIMEFHHC